MRHLLSQTSLLFTLALGAAGSLSLLVNHPAAILDDWTLALVRGADYGQNNDGTSQSCDEINAGTGLSEAQCQAAGPFPSSDTCVMCSDQPVANVPNPRANPDGGRLRETDPYQCAGDKYVGTRVAASPFEGGQASCELPPMPTGKCIGVLKQYLVQSTTPPGLGPN